MARISLSDLALFVVNPSIYPGPSFHTQAVGLFAQLAESKANLSILAKATQNDRAFYVVGNKKKFQSVM